MSTIYLHCGQAGNEVGGALWRLAWNEKPPRRWFFDERGTARAVFVDTEPKVVRGVVHALGPERVHPRCALVEQSGRGNNWAMGYNGVDGSGRNGIADAALEALRWQWERCDWCTGLVLCHSIGGGTGSGLGSLLLQELRDAYPRHYLTAAAICPFAAGELPLGQYNATLALSFLQEFADATILFDNTQLLRHLTSAVAAQSHSASHSSTSPARLDMRHLDACARHGARNDDLPRRRAAANSAAEPAPLISPPFLSLPLARAQLRGVWPRRPDLPDRWALGPAAVRRSRSGGVGVPDARAQVPHAADGTGAAAGRRGSRGRWRRGPRRCLELKGGGRGARERRRATRAVGGARRRHRVACAPLGALEPLRLAVYRRRRLQAA